MNYNQYVLVDSSVWIEYFRGGRIKLLKALLEEDLVCTNELILTELTPSLQLLNHVEVIESLNSLYLVPLSVDWNLIRKYQEINLKNGINNVGIPDLIILQQVIENGLTLFTKDKHFKLMNKLFKFDILS